MDHQEALKEARAGRSGAGRSTEERSHAQAEEEARLIAEGGVGWPDAWPEDIPKIEGAVRDFFEENGDLFVYLAVTGPDVVKAYAEELVSFGFDRGTSWEENGAFRAFLTGKGYKTFYISYEPGEPCVVGFNK